MTPFGYSQAARKLQDRFDTRNLADAELAVIVHDELSEPDKGFISAAEMFWLASVDDKGTTGRRCPDHFPASSTRVRKV